MARRVETEKPAGVWPDFIAPPQYEDAAPEWEDPRLPDFRLIWAAAREVGYSIGLHGSMKRDCDLIAAPWTDEAVGNADLVDHLCKALNARIVGGPTQKPLGRVALSLQIDGWFKVIDLSICPRVGGTLVSAEQAAQIAADAWGDGFAACALLFSGHYADYAMLRDAYLSSRPAPVSAQKEKADG